MNSYFQNTTFKILILLTVISAFHLSCEKEIELIIPPAENKYVIEGIIETGLPPLILISQTKDYNESLTLDSFHDFYLGGASVTVSHDELSHSLTEVCTADLPPDILLQVAQALNISYNVLVNSGLCAYTDLSGNLIGETNTTYKLHVEINGETLSSSTHIPGMVELDSLWFEISGNTDSLGYVFGTLTDPDTLGNAYRWYAKRINRYPAWSPYAGFEKDQQYIAPLGSAFNDTFFNGLSFDFAYFRGASSGSGKEDDFNEEAGFFKTGDTIAVKGMSIDLNTYQYVTSFESEAGSAGNPFTAPSSIYTNINGGIGIWAGYASYLDTVLAIP